jgi:hypothetical protein
MPRNAPALLLAAALVAAGAMALILTRELTFLQDTWEYLMNRRDPSAEALFHPHNEHLVLFPVLIEEALLRLFGMTSATPEYVVLIGFLLGTALLLYVYVKRRVGPWPALLATIAILCLGPAWEVLLWPFEISFVGPVFFGIAMLLALEREDALGDLAACLFLIAALGFSGLGIPFLAAAVVAIAVGRRDRWLVRAYIVVVPVALYAVWYLQWGHEAQTQLSAHNVLNSPQVVAEAISVAVGSLVGLAATPVGGSITPLWGALVLVALIVALAYRQLRVRPGIARGLWPVAAAAAAFWILLAFNQSPGRDASASRYQYGGAIFVVLILANLLQGVRPGRRVLLFAATVTAVGVALNLVVLHQGRNALLQQAVLTRADTAAIEIARRSVDPEFQLNPELAGTPTLVDVFAGKYFQAVDEYGSPAYSPAELATAPEPGRRQADIVLGQALPISTDTSLGAYDAAAGAGCAEAGGGALSELPVSAGLTRIELAPGPHASFSLRRFAVGEYPVVTEGALGGSVTILRIPRDTLARPWHLLVEASQAARVCAGPG